MKLLLVQHAEPKREEEDPDRPLSEKGWSDIRKVATFINRHINFKINSIKYSPKTRAQQTAEVLGECLNPSEGVKEAEGLKPLDNPSTWADHLSKARENIILVGHLPHLCGLASQLLCQDKSRTLINFQMGGATCMEKDESGSWTLCWIVVPEIL
jgi:phosphohistidine phosphatase